MIKISLILFDLNGVLYRYERGARIAYLNSISGRSAGAIKRAVWDSGFEDAGDSGALDVSTYLRDFGACIGYNISESEWIAALRIAVTPITATLALMSRIRINVRCAVLTNNNLLVLRHFAVVYPDVATVVGNQVCVSAEFGARKPEPEVYRRCLAKLGVAPMATLFVDDSVTNVAGAREAGLHGHHYTDLKAFTAELEKFGLLN